jgi:hypothetical protein
MNGARFLPFTSWLDFSRGGRVDGRLQQEEMLTDGRGRPTGQSVTRVLTQMGLLASDGGQLVSTTQLNDRHYSDKDVHGV